MSEWITAALTPPATVGPREPWPGSACGGIGPDPTPVFTSHVFTAAGRYCRYALLASDLPSTERGPGGAAVVPSTTAALLCLLSRNLVPPPPASGGHLGQQVSLCGLRSHPQLRVIVRVIPRIAPAAGVPRGSRPTTPRSGADPLELWRVLLSGGSAQASKLNRSTHQRTWAPARGRCVGYASPREGDQIDQDREQEEQGVTTQYVLCSGKLGPSPASAWRSGKRRGAGNPAPRPTLRVTEALMMDGHPRVRMTPAIGPPVLSSTGHLSQA
jgi:hypothetical protein